MFLCIIKDDVDSGTCFKLLLAFLYVQRLTRVPGNWRGASLFPVVPCLLCLISFHDLYLNFIPCSTGKGRDYWKDKNIIEEMPCCRQMFNIFHPFDPVAYRFVASLQFCFLMFGEFVKHTIPQRN
jgi:hypothetical protein